MNKISMLEVSALSITVVVSTAVLFTPYLAAQAAGQDAWISVIVAGMLTAIPAWAAGAVMSRFPQQSIISVLTKLFGSFLGKLISIVLAGYLLMSAVLAIWRLEAFVARFLIPETPQLAVRLIFLIVLAYATFSGSTPLIRTNVYVMPVGVLVILLVTGLPMARMDPSFLLPVFENGYQPMLSGAILLTGWLCQVPVVILMFNKYIEPKFLFGGGRKAAIGLIIAALAMELGALGTLAAFGPQQTSTMFYPSFALARVISIGAFLEHIEVIFIAVWVASIFITSAFFIQAFSESVSDIVNLKGRSQKVWIILGTFLLLLVWPFFLDHSFYALISVIENIGSVTGIIIGGAIPILMLTRVIILPPPKEKNQTPGESGSNEKS